MLESIFSVYNLFTNNLNFLKLKYFKSRKVLMKMSFEEEFISNLNTTRILN